MVPSEADEYAAALVIQRGARSQSSFKKERVGRAKSSNFMTKLDEASDAAVSVEHAASVEITDSDRADSRARFGI